MRITVPLLLSAGLTVFIFSGISSKKTVTGGDETHAAAVARGLIVHEWGTFTSISGSDGIRLEFRPLIDNDLPSFVVNRAWQAGRLSNPWVKWDIRSLQRMETPVTYFYTDHEREIDVKVGFPKGLLTEFYPPVTSMKPEFNFEKRADIGNSELDWGKVTLIPMDRFIPSLSSPEIAQAAHRRIVDTLVPDSHSHPHYEYARETDSAFVYVPHQRDDNRPLAPVGDHFEKFLFYRGVGNFSLPLTVAAKGNDTYEVTNAGPELLRSLFLVTCVSDSVRVQRIQSIEAGAKLTIQQRSEEIDRNLLSNMVIHALVKEGLYEKEARAMVKTWQDSWFREEGTRLFYLLPKTLTEELLPLTISPTPEQVVRVMVGRMEVISLQEEARITQIVQTSAQARDAAAKQAATAPNSVKQSQKPTLPEALTQMGRLAEPALIRVKSFTNDDTIRTEARLLLDELHNYQKNLLK